MITSDEIVENLEEFMHICRPRYSATPSMCGRYPCWILWLPKCGRCERKTMKEGIVEFIEQTRHDG